MNLVDLSARTLDQLGDVGPFSFGMWRFTDASTGSTGTGPDLARSNRHLVRFFSTGQKSATK